MIIGFLNICLFVYGVFSLRYRKINHYLFILIYFSTSFFGFIAPYINYGFKDINNTDFAVILFIIGIFTLPKKYNSISLLKSYITLKKIINTFIIFIFALIIYDLIIASNTFINIIIETRLYLFLFVLKLIDRIKLKDIYPLLYLIAVFVSVKSVIYSCQYFFNFEIFETPKFLSSIGKFSGFNVISPLIIVFLLAKSKTPSFVDRLFIFFLILSSLLIAASGYILINTAIISLYLYHHKSSIRHRILQIFIIPLLILYVLTNQSDVLNDFSTDYSEAISFKSNFDNSRDLNQFYHAGSFQFRLAQVAERVNYLIDNNKLLFGDGFTPDSKLIRQLFVIGTHTNTTLFGVQQYNSADILYVNTISRFGLIGTIFFISVFVYLIKFRKYNPFFVNSFLIFLIISSLNSNLLFRMENFLVLFLFLLFVLEAKLNTYLLSKS